MSADLAAVETALRDFALTLPEAHEDFPWGERVIKVRGKIFLFLGVVDGRLRLNVKLPQSRDFALARDFTQPTGYGLGRAGWVTARFGPEDDLPLDVLQAWTRESYRAIAPKRLAALVAG